MKYTLKNAISDAALMLAGPAAIYFLIVIIGG